MWQLAFWKAVFERAVKTFAQTLAGFLVGSSLGIGDINWTDSLSIAGVAALASVLTSIGSALATDGGPSLGNVEKLS